MKKTLLVISSFILCVMLFFGCSFIEPNKKLYYNAIVLETTVKINGEDKYFKVTVEEVVEGLNNFGYSQYFNTNSNNTGLSDEEAIKKTTIDLLDEKILIEYAKTMPSYQLTNYDIKKAKDYTYGYINSYISSYESQIREEWELTDPESDASASEEAGIEYEEYEKIIDRKYNHELGSVEFAFVETLEEEELYEIAMLSLNISDWDSELKYASHGAVETPEEDDRKVFEEAKRRLFRYLKLNYEEKGIVNKTNTELLNLEIERIFELQKESLMLTKMQKAMSESISKGELAMNSVNQKVAEKFIELYSKEKEKYSTIGTSGVITDAEKESYRKYLKENPTATPTYFYPITGEHFVVQHILLSYTEAQTNEINAIKANTKILEDDKDQDILGIADKITVNDEDWDTIYKKVKKAVNDASGLDEKAEIFRNYMFQYTGDTGTLNASGDYIIPIDSNYDSMMPEFAKISRNLQEDGTIGGVDIALTDYGYHIIMYVGMVENKFEGIKNLSTALGSADVFTICNTLYNTPVKVGHNKNYYDEVFEQVEMASFESFANGIIKPAKNGATLTWHKNVYKDILKITMKR